MESSVRKDDQTADWRRMALSVLEIECAALEGLRASVDESFFAAVDLLRQLRGKVICCGVGKSGHIAGKIAATLSSTGMPAFFMHPAEAGHGDLGMVGDGDAVLMFSYSGESRELQDLIPALKRLQIPMIAIIGDLSSSLAQAADLCLSAAVAREACPHNLAPTASTTAALALGDALAMTLLHARGFSPDDFARTHPSGNLGRQLLWRVSDVMRSGEEVPIVAGDAKFSEVLLEMTGKRMGMTLVCDADRRLCGIITDGDLRRAMDKIGDLRELNATDLMTASPQIIAPTMLAADALRQMKEKILNHLVVTAAGDEVVGAVSVHDFLRHRIL